MFSGGGGFTSGTNQTAQPATSNFGFSAPPNASPFTFGSPASIPSASIAPQQQQTNVVAPTFGISSPFSNTNQTATSSTGFSFGTPATTTQATPGLSLNLGGQQQQQQQPFTFGTGTSTAPATNTFGGFNLGGTTTVSPAISSVAPSTFGTFSTPAPATTSTGFAFGTTPTPAPATGFTNFGTGTTAAAAPQTNTFGFGTQPVASAATTSAFGLPSFTTTTTTATPATGITFGAPALTTPASTGLTLNLGATQPQPAFSFGTGAAAAPTTNTFGGFNLGGTTINAAQPTTTSSFTGLGGVQPSIGGGLAGIGGLIGSSVKPEGRAVLDLPVPPELLQIVEELKTHMKNQKVKMSEVCRATDKNIDKVSEEVEETRLAVSNLANQVQRQVLFCNSLMKDTQDEMKNVDMALITKDTPLALQNEITAPTAYFYNLVSSYHERMVAYKREIERAEIALASLGNNNACSPKDLVLGLRGTKDTVVALAAKVQDLHEHIINELAVSRNLKRFPMEGDGASGRRPGNVPGESNIGGHYDQTYHKLNVLFNTPQRSVGGGGDIFYRPASSSSTPILPAGLTSQQAQLFQTASSTILGSPMGPGLKRTKH